MKRQEDEKKKKEREFDVSAVSYSLDISFYVSRFQVKTGKSSKFVLH